MKTRGGEHTRMRTHGGEHGGKHTEESTWWGTLGQDNGQEEHPQICTIRLLQLARDHTKNISQMGLREIAANIT